MRLQTRRKGAVRKMRVVVGQKRKRKWKEVRIAEVENETRRLQRRCCSPLLRLWLLLRRLFLAGWTPSVFGRS